MNLISLPHPALGGVLANRTGDDPGVESGAPPRRARARTNKTAPRRDGLCVTLTATGAATGAVPTSSMLFVMAAQNQGNDPHIWGASGYVQRAVRCQSYRRSWTYRSFRSICTITVK
jgi:hypothetical protein